MSASLHRAAPLLLAGLLLALPAAAANPVPLPPLPDGLVDPAGCLVVPAPDVPCIPVGLAEQAIRHALAVTELPVAASGDCIVQTMMLDYEMSLCATASSHAGYLFVCFSFHAGSIGVDAEFPPDGPALWVPFVQPSSGDSDGGLPVQFGMERVGVMTGC